MAARQRLARFEDLGSSEDTNNEKAQRDSWMLVPPKESDWTARVDPTKIRARKFQSGKSAKSSPGGDTTLWTETAAEKQKRVNEEVMGLRKLATEASTKGKVDANSTEADETARRIKEYNVGLQVASSASKKYILTLRLG